MTKEELKQEAEECANMFTNLLPFRSAYKEGYIDSAEPREKRIAELKKQLDLKEKALSKAKKETKRIADRVNKDKRRLIRRKAELEAQIEKMKCCSRCKHYSMSFLPYYCTKNNTAPHCTSKCDKWEIKEND